MLGPSLPLPQIPLILFNCRVRDAGPVLIVVVCCFLNGTLPHAGGGIPLPENPVPVRGGLLLKHVGGGPTLSLGGTFFVLHFTPAVVGGPLLPKKVLGPRLFAIFTAALDLPIIEAPLIWRAALCV